MVSIFTIPQPDLGADVAITPPTTPGPATNPPSDNSLLDVRAFIIVAVSTLTALFTGAAAGLGSAYGANAPVAVSLLVGFATALPAVFGTALTMNTLISKI